MVPVFTGFICFKQKESLDNHVLIYRTMANLSLHSNYILIVWDLLSRFYYFSFPLCPIDCDKTTIKNKFFMLSKAKKEWTKMDEFLAILTNEIKILKRVKAWLEPNLHKT